MMKGCPLHDFRIVDGEQQINLIFDVVVPHSYSDKDMDAASSGYRRESQRSGPPLSVCGYVGKRIYRGRFLRRLFSGGIAERIATKNFKKIKKFKKSTCIEIKLCYNNIR